MSAAVSVWVVEFVPMFASKLVPLAVDRFHWNVMLLGMPSGSVMPPALAVRVRVSSAAPGMAGLPVAGPFTARRFSTFSRRLLCSWQGR